MSWFEFSEFSEFSELLSGTVMLCNLVASIADRLPLRSMQLELCASPVPLPVFNNDTLVCCIDPRLPIKPLQNAVQVDLCRSFAFDPQRLQCGCANFCCFNIRCRIWLVLLCCCENVDSSSIRQQYLLRTLKLNVQLLSKSQRYPAQMLSQLNSRCDPGKRYIFTFVTGFQTGRTFGELW